MLCILRSASVNSIRRHKLRSLVIGQGMLGTALVDALCEAGHETIGSTRDPLSSHLYLDMTKPIPTLPSVDTVFISAAVSSYRLSEGNPDAWITNADSPVAICRQALDRGMFPVFVSSAAVEYMSNAYTRMKLYAESCIIPMGGAVIRPRKFTPDNIGSLCHLMIRVGLDRKPGVYRWP